MVHLRRVLEHDELQARQVHTHFLNAGIAVSEQARLVSRIRPRAGDDAGAILGHLAVPLLDHVLDFARGDDALLDQQLAHGDLEELPFLGRLLDVRLEGAVIVRMVMIVVMVVIMIVVMVVIVAHAALRALSSGSSVMIEKFVRSRGTVLNEFLDLNQTRKHMILVPLLIPKFARDICIEVWRTSELGH